MSEAQPTGRDVSLDGLVVVGEATRSLPPDTVEVVVGVQTSGASAARALRENAATMQRVLHALLLLDIGQSNLTTTGLSLMPLLQQPGQPLSPAPQFGAPVAQPGGTAPRTAPFFHSSATERARRTTQPAAASASRSSSSPRP